MPTFLTKPRGELLDTFPRSFSPRRTSGFEYGKKTLRIATVMMLTSIKYLIIGGFHFLKGLPKAVVKVFIPKEVEEWHDVYGKSGVRTDNFAILQKHNKEALNSLVNGKTGYSNKRRRNG